MHPVLVTSLDSPSFRQWGLQAERIPAPCVVLDARAAIHEALHLGRTAFPEARAVCYAQPEFLAAFFSQHYLYEGGLHRWLAQASSYPLVFRRIDTTAPADLLCVHASAIDGADPCAPSTHTGEIELDLLRDDTRRKTLVFGDSHVFNLYTNVALIGGRGVVVERVRVHGVDELKVSRHIGSVTMHRLSTRGELNAKFFRTYGLRPGDRVVAVCGEIDVRNHVGRVALAHGIPVAHVIEELCGRFCSTLAAAVAQFGPLRVVLSCPTPPLDFARLDPSNVVAHWGTLEERIAATHIMRQCLARESRARGWGLIDVYDLYADAQGALDFARSDKFCHVAHAHKGPAVAALQRVMEDLA